MNMQMQYSYENTWTTTQESDIIKIIIEELGDVEPQGILLYIKEALSSGKVINIGSCRFKKGV